MVVFVRRFTTKIRLYYVARKATWFLIILLAVIGGFVVKGVVDARASTREFRAFADKVAEADSLSIHEGLPSPSWESDLFDSEYGRGVHTTYEGFAFYREPMLIEGQEATELTRRIREVAIPYRGAKTCGQFHPDFMAEWKVDGSSYRVHVCFSCHELRVVGPNSDFLMDIDDGEFPSFKEGLWAYLDKRPYSTVEGVNDFWQDFYFAETASLHLGGKHAPPGSVTVPIIDGHSRTNEAERLTDQDKSRVAEILIRKGAVRKHTEKKCLFDPDYVLSWHIEGQFDVMPICLTCAEIQSGTRRFDVSPHALKHLQVTLEPYALKLGKKPAVAR